MNFVWFSIVPSGSKNQRSAHENPKVRPPGRRSGIVCFIRVAALHVASGHFYVASDRFYVASGHFHVASGHFHVASAAKARNTRNYNGFQPVPCGQSDSSDIAKCPSGNPSVIHTETSRNTTFSNGFAYYHTFLRIPLTTHHMYIP